MPKAAQARPKTDWKILKAIRGTAQYKPTYTRPTQERLEHTRKKWDLPPGDSSCTWVVRSFLQTYEMVTGPITTAQSRARGSDETLSDRDPLEEYDADDKSDDQLAASSLTGSHGNRGGNLGNRAIGNSHEDDLQSASRRKMVQMQSEMLKASMENQQVLNLSRCSRYCKRTSDAITSSQSVSVS
ncbi:hypothetical protein BDD12DRAFT_886655 [Trichophaea hybrida]|nr:hypothetical protein BDD12DRAFT_886655 [Trichophaea hybrida]